MTTTDGLAAEHRDGATKTSCHTSSSPKTKETENSSEPVRKEINRFLCSQSGTLSLHTKNCRAEHRLLKIINLKRLLSHYFNDAHSNKLVLRIWKVKFEYKCHAIAMLYCDRYGFIIMRP